MHVAIDVIIKENWEKCVRNAKKTSKYRRKRKIMFQKLHITAHNFNN
jgi:hypothetical protein